MKMLNGMVGSTSLRWTRTVCWLLVAGVLMASAAAAVAQVTANPAATDASAPAAATSTPAATSSKVSLGDLFIGSFDLFTVLLIIGSLAGWTIIIVCLIEVRKSNISPEEPEQIISGLCKGGRWADLRAFVAEDDAFVSKVMRAAMAVPVDDKDAVREAAEMAASEESARWFRKVEPLNVIGNLGPLLGLAGTVWGMIIAFAALGQAGGQASPANLSLGVSKALFHTLLGLLLAVPCLTVFGFYRTMIDKLCTRAMVVCGGLVEMLPREARLRVGDATAGGGARPAGPGGPPMPARPVAPAPR